MYPLLIDTHKGEQKISSNNIYIPLRVCRNLKYDLFLSRNSDYFKTIMCKNLESSFGPAK